MAMRHRQSLGIGSCWCKMLKSCSCLYLTLLLSIDASNSLWGKQSMLPKEKLLLVILDGVGHRASNIGNAVTGAPTPWIDYLAQHGLFTTLKAHGKWIGMPEQDDFGNSEVGHNTIGAGRVFDQGAKVVQQAIANGEIFRRSIWRDAVARVIANNSTLHFLGLLSDGNVHAHQAHLHAMISQAKIEGVQRVRVHALLDGRDVDVKSAERYLGHLLVHMQQLRSADFDVEIASCGGRMSITMDRYQANWEMVKRGWDLHVLGKGRIFSSVQEGIASIRTEHGDDDQFLPPFAIDVPHRTVEDGDTVIMFNFRGDRAIEVTEAFTTETFTKFDREKTPDIYYAGMTEYDPDRRLPKNFLVAPQKIDSPLTEYLLPYRVRQFACSESQKFGHVTYFWNGNRSGYFDRSLEEYLEVDSDKDLRFDNSPWMKALEITDATIERIENGMFDFGRINFANGDMVGHTGNYQAAIIAVAVVDMMIGRLIKSCRRHQVNLIVTADHGNCDEMLTTDNNPKTSHSLSEVPFYFFSPHDQSRYQLISVVNPTLANIANSVLQVIGLPINDDYHQSLLLRQ